jgi:hypothetical protein
VYGERSAFETAVRTVDQPYMLRDEAASYTDLMPDGKERRPDRLCHKAAPLRHEAHAFGPHDFRSLAWSRRSAFFAPKAFVSTSRARATVSCSCSVIA